MRFDVIVAGAGPAGSTTARECAERGLSVLLLDKAEFPRDKPCGGAVTVRAAGLLPFEITPVVERVLTRFHVTVGHSRGFTRSAPEKVTYLTQRSRLDAFLAECAVKAGATLREREPVREVERHSTHLVVRTTSGSYEGSTLVAADGANGSTARLAGIDMSFLHGIALEGNITPAAGVPAQWEDAIGLDMGGLPGGYGWLFPKGDHLNIGLGGWRYIAPTLRERLNELVRFYGFHPEDLWGLRGYHLPLRQPGSPLVDGRVLLVGDAAGLIDPLTGEGIFAALWSGRTAAEEIPAFLEGKVPDLQGYGREVERVLVPELAISRRIHDIFHLWPGLFLAIERWTSIPWRAMPPLLLGEITYITVRQRLGKLWPVAELVSDLARVWPPMRRLAGLRDTVPPQRFFRRGEQRPTPPP